MMRILCAGDRFISPALCVSTLRKEIGEAAYSIDVSDWPDEPFRDNAEIREWCGDEGRIAALVSNVDIFVTHIAPISERVLNAANDLRLIATPRGGPVNVNVAAATARGIPIAHLPGRNARAVAEFAVAALISGQRNIVDAATRLRNGDWAGHFYRYEETGTELASQTVGLIGLGEVGRRVAVLLRGFGTKVLAYDPYVDRDVAIEAGAEAVGFSELLRRSDAVSVHARLTAETRGMFGTAAFSTMRPGAYFVNTARGEIVDEVALNDALESGHLAGAALDVYAPEPPDSGNPLLRRHNVIATPHIAGASTQVAERAARRIAAEVGRFLRGEPLQACLNPEALR